MNNLQLKILNIFREFKNGVGHVLNPQSLNSKISQWDRRSQDESQTAIENLVTEGFISYDGSHFILNQSGYDKIWEGYTLQDTENFILNIYRERNLGIGHGLHPAALNGIRNNAERFHMDNMGTAWQSLVDKGYLNENGQLQQTGYDKIY